MRAERRGNPWLYGFSLVIGLMGTGLVFESEVNETTENSHLPQRALYTFILFVAGLLFETARPPESKTNISRRPNLIPPSSDSHEENLPETSEQKLCVASIRSGSHVAISMRELKHAPLVEDEKVEKIISAEEKETTSLATPFLSEYARQSKPIARWRRWRSSCVSLSFNLIPGVWLAQSLVLFIQNALEESATSELLPYTALTGLATGYLFRINIKPWQSGQLEKIRYWIENHRNELTIPEYVIYHILLSFKLIKPYFLFSATTASFWTGYNLEELTTQITDKIRRWCSTSVAENLPHEQAVTEQTFFPHWPTALFTSVSGAALTGFSFLTMSQPTANVDQMALKNNGVLWMASIGNYVFAYPLGIYLGHYLPRRYQLKALIAATYLLVPFANPDLTIPHYILLAGAGLCGGVAHFIIKDQYHYELAQMQQQKQRIDNFPMETKPFFDLLFQLPLPNDLLLQQKQIKQKKMTLIVKVAYILALLNALYYIFDTAINNQPGGIIATHSLFALSDILIYIGGFHLLKRKTPSVYARDSMTWLEQFFYRDSFSLTFLFKICIILKIKSELLISTDSESYPNLSAFNTAMYTLIATLIVAKALSRRDQGYQPYVPDPGDVEQLKNELKLESLRRRVESGDSRLSCSYHLLRFMQKNPPDLQIEVQTHALGEKKPQNTLGVSSEEKYSQFPRLTWRSLPREEKSRARTPEIVSSVPVAALFREDSDEAQLTLEASFDSKHDKIYTNRKLNISFVVRAGDAAIRGSTVAGQFAVGLPEGLSLNPNITSFRF